MTTLLWNLLLALTWVMLTGVFTPGNFVLGFLLSYAMLWAAERTAGIPVYFRRVRQGIGFTLFFLRELIKANLRVAYDVVTPTHYMRPGILAVPLDVETDAEITLLANVISLTPGTLSLDVSDDRRILYVHAMYVDDPEAARREIKEGFERRILEMMR